MDKKVEEIRKLMDIAHENLNSAKILFQNGLYRDAISRAYYAMYHSAKAVLLTKDVIPKKHAGVISMFGLHFVNKGFVEEVYANAIAKAYNLRVKSDYDAFYEPKKDEAEDVIEWAEKFVERVEKLLKVLL
jgi:uncharacterized protein (UPF0332 family)